MTGIIVNFLTWLAGLITAHFPTVEMGGSLANVVDGVTYLVNMVAKSNWLFPVPDIMLVLGILLGIRSFKLGMFVLNWVVRRILDVVP